MATLLKLITNAKGATAIEYALIASLIAIAAIASMRGLGLKLLGMYANVANALP
jgi:pilus assembly protein Flp/PilA